MSSECTVVMFTFGEEPVPYRSKISGRTVTLRQFKDILPKKGNYKYVTLCLHVLVSRITIKTFALADIISRPTAMMMWPRQFIRK